MKFSRASRLQGALRNYLRSGISQFFSEYTENYEKYAIMLKFIILYVTVSAGVLLIEFYCHWRSNCFLINTTWFLAVCLCFSYVLFRKYFPCWAIFRLLISKFCLRSSSDVSTEDRRIQANEHATSQLATQHSTVDEQTACHLSTQQDSSEEITADQLADLDQRPEEQTALCVFRRYLSSLTIFRIFCCPRNCYSTSTVSTEDLVMRNVVNSANQIAVPHNTCEEQNINQFGIIQEQLVLAPAAPQATYQDVYATLQLAEQRLLQYLSSNSGEQELPSNE